MRFQASLTLAFAMLVGATLSVEIARADQAESRWTFDESSARTLPDGWTSGRTGEGPGSVWEIVADDTAPSGAMTLAQKSDAGPNPVFNVCVVEAPRPQDLDLSVKFKAVAGQLDQGGGPVWRFRDMNNYYVARYNPLENNFRVYKVVGGKRTQLATAEAKAPAGKWGEIRVIHRADHIKCWLDGELLLDVRDDALSDAGQVGLWTKADAVTYFDDLSVKNLDAEK